MPPDVRLPIQYFLEVDQALAHVVGLYRFCHQVDVLLVPDAEPEVVCVVAHVHREGLVPPRVEVVVDDARLEDAGGAERGGDKGVRRVVGVDVEEGPEVDL